MYIESVEESSRAETKTLDFGYYDVWQLYLIAFDKWSFFLCIFFLNISLSIFSLDF